MIFAGIISHENYFSKESNANIPWKREDVSKNIF